MAGTLVALRYLAAEGNPFTYARNPSKYVDSVLLGTLNTRESVTVPANAKFLIFSSTADFYAKPDDGSANVAAAADVADGTSGELNPTVWNVEGVATIGLLAPAANTVVTLSYYK